MSKRVSTTKIYDILVEKKETTFYANDIMLEIKLSYETLYACYNEKIVQILLNRYVGFYLFLKIRDKEEISGFEKVPDRFLRTQSSFNTFYKIIDNKTII